MIAEYRKQFSQLNHIHLVEKEDFGRGEIYGYDAGKLVFSVKNCGLQTEEGVLPFTGTMLADMLHREYGQIMEMAGSSYIIALTSVADSKEAFEALFRALESIDRQLTNYEEISDTTLYRVFPERRMEIADAVEADSMEVSYIEAAGRISHEFIYAYPPGIPIVTPGEVLSREILKEIKKAMDKGLNIKGVRKQEEIFISVVKSETSY